MTPWVGVRESQSTLYGVAPWLGLGTRNPRFVVWPLELGLETLNPRFVAWIYTEELAIVNLIAEEEGIPVPMKTPFSHAAVPRCPTKCHNLVAVVPCVCGGNANMNI